MDVHISGNLTKMEKQPIQTQPGTVCFITTCASDYFYIFENQVQEYKSLTLTKVQSQHRHCAQQLFCLEAIDPRLAMVS